MLNIFYADALTDKEQFLFDHIDPARRTILLVPDQFSLQAERDALGYAARRRAGGGAALLNLMVTDFSALGHKVVKETAGHGPRILDKYGRHMLLSVLIDQLSEELTVLKPRRSSNALAEQMNRLISEMKRYHTGPAMLEETIAQLKEETVSQAERAGDGKAKCDYLTLKLEDMLRIFRAYEDRTQEIYQDAEDYITYYADRIPQASLVQGSDVWIYGFDTFTPKNLQVIRSLLQTAASVSVVLSYEERGGAYPQTAALRNLTQGGGIGLFRLTDQVMTDLEEEASKVGSRSQRGRITGYRRNSLWNTSGPEGASPKEPTDPMGDRIHLMQAGGTHEEAESAAAFIQSLVRDQGYRYGEIAVLCNDMEGRGRQLLRSFSRWEIPVFADQKRGVLHQPVVSFLLSFFDVLTAGYRGNGIAGMMKSGLLGWEPEDEFLMENYIREFHIRGRRWNDPFTWTGGTYTEEQMERLNRMREFLVSVCDRARDSMGRRNTAGQKVEGLISFLQEELKMPERIQQMQQRQSSMGLMEEAAQTGQIWNAICGIFDQIVQVIGEEKISNTLLRDMVQTGLAQVELGLVPASSDHVMLGTLQRTRPGRIRALIVTGANAGLLPLEAAEEGLFSRRERIRLQEKNLRFVSREQIAQMEEQLAIYRTFSLPEEVLYVSCSQSSDDGSMLRPSEVFHELTRYQPDIASDLEQRPLREQIGSAAATMPYLAEAMRREAAGEVFDPAWHQVQDWYRIHEPVQHERLFRAASFSNHREALGEELADALYRGDRQAMEASTSRLEKYSSCPFAHFIQYGLRASEQRLFEVGGREIGDVYHQCMMAFSQALEGDQCEADWHSVTRTQCGELIDQILQGSLMNYRQGLFTADGANAFRYERIREICEDVAWAMVEQVRRGRIRAMYFEEPFGRGRQLAPIRVNAAGRQVLIRGIIDRVDVVDAGEDLPPGIRIVDYKTGNPQIRPKDYEIGYRLQLMVYMEAAMQGGENLRAPAGVFHFKIREFMMDGDTGTSLPDPEDPGDLQRRMQRFYRLEGIAVKDPALLGAMDESLASGNKTESSVIPVKYDPSKEGFLRASGGTLMEQEEFQQLMTAVRSQAERICEGICRGDISVLPKREAKKDRDGNRISACRYCGFRSICGFDPSIRGCRYEDI